MQAWPNCLTVPCLPEGPKLTHIIIMILVFAMLSFLFCSKDHLYVMALHFINF